MEPGRQHITERRGVALVQTKVVDQLRWLFREQTVSDLGVDAQVEVLREGKSSGRLIALQIKSGDSYFRGCTVEGIVYRDDRQHLDYWLGHSLPVVLVLCRPDTGEAYWQHISPETAVRTSFGCRVFVPRVNRLDSSAVDALARLAFPGPSEAVREAEIPWTELLDALGAAAESAVASMTIVGVTYELRRLARESQYSAILVGADLVSPRIALLQFAGRSWSLVGHVPVNTRGADAVPVRFVQGRGGIAFVVRAPEAWGTGTVLDTTRWYWIEDGVAQVLAYPSSAYVVGWGLAFDRFVSSEEEAMPWELTDGYILRVTFMIRYTPPDADPDGPEAVVQKSTLAVQWHEDRRVFRETEGSDLTLDDVDQLYRDTETSFVARNIDVLTTVGRSGAEWARRWVAALAERSLPDDRKRLLKSIQAPGGR